MSARFAAGAEASGSAKAGQLFSQPLAGAAGSSAGVGAGAGLAGAGLVETGGIARALSQTAPVDQAKVAALKAAVQMSSYAVEPQRIADAMMASLRAR